MIDCLLFKVKERILALPLRDVREITHLPLLQDVPFVGKGYLGMLNYRSYSLPVYDLSEILFGEPTLINLKTKTLIMGEERLVGIVFDDVEENASGVQVDSKDKGIFKKLIQVGDKIIPLIDYEFILQKIDEDRSIRLPNYCIGSLKLKEIFERRLRQLSKAEDETISIKTSYLVFKLNEEFYAVDAKLVEEVVRAEQVFRVPMAPHFVNGIFSLRGNIVTVLDLKADYFQEAAPTESEAKILIFDYEKRKVGLIVDSVVDFVSVENKKKFSQHLISSEISSIVTEQFEFSGKLVSILDIEKFFKKIYKKEGVA